MTDAEWTRLRERIEYLEHEAFTGERRPEFLRAADGNLPPDTRQCGPGPDDFSYDSGIEIHEKDGYWEVNDFSIEWSSSYHATGRGLTLAEALADLEAHEG
jgi:hypothetical protein